MEETTNQTSESVPLENKPAEPVVVSTPTTSPAPAPSTQETSVPKPENPVQYNTSNGPIGINGPMPDELRGWNWGAFFLNWIWGVANNVWIALLGFVPLVGVIMPFVLGAKGNEWAWQHRKFESVAQFKDVQKKWAIWGLVLFLAETILVIMFYSLLIGLFIGGMAGSSSDTTTQDNSPYTQAY